ncbi:phosphoribosyltransferase family protein [Actinoplanes sp. NPDC051411]|uniref:phosphoribosyltransferase n=1 Tax=Actinoplanes sp. NPDC051411 TaxID=3155522 RepID=UPI00342CBEE7
MLFADRDQAGRELADEITRLCPPGAADQRPLVLALPRGGVPVAAHVAAAIDADLGVVVARKIGAPGRPEYGIGAIAEDGPPTFDIEALDALGLTETDLAGAVAAERTELARRIRRYRGDRPLPAMTGRTVILVDDGLATGVTAVATLRWLRLRAPARLMLAVPVCAAAARDLVDAESDQVVCLHMPPLFRAVGRWYDDFAQLTDADVDRLLHAAAH